MVTTRPPNDQGFASIIIVLTLVIILGLMALGFGRLMRNEQRSALDRQLSTQAYYAAESGINDAQNALQKGYTTPASNPGTTCLNPASVGSGYNNVLSSTNNVEYTCLMINTHPSSLMYNPIGTTDSKYVTLTAQTNTGAPSAIGSMRISWQSQDGSAVYSPFSVGNFPVQSGWKNGTQAIGPGVIRVSLTPLSALDQQGLINNTLTGYLYPSSAGTGSLNYSAMNGAAIPAGSNAMQQQGQIVSGGCQSANTPLQCNALITNIGAASQYLLRLKSIYNPSDVEVQAYASTDGSGTPLELTGAQAVVDSTGKAGDVLRRVQARVPEASEYYMPEGTIDAANAICKLMQTEAPPNTTDSCP